MQAGTPTTPLRVQRLSLTDWQALVRGGKAPLGGLGYGVQEASAGNTGSLAGIHTRALGGSGPLVDAWLSQPSPATALDNTSDGQCGSVQWRSDGQWLFGSLEFNEAALGESVAGLAQQAYADVFATLAHTGCPHLLRLWNYLPHINADSDGLERYRQFNLGRQQAFIDAGQAIFEGAPAACAIGTRSGPFCVRFLAGRTPPVAVENPRQVSAYHYPTTYGPRSPTFSRAAIVDVGGGQVALLISGTASIVGHESVHLGDVRAQTEETLRNLQAIVDTAQARSSARFDRVDLSCTVYVRHAADLPTIRAVLESSLGADSPAVRDAVFLEGDICRADLLVEIEAHALAAGEVLR